MPFSRGNIDHHRPLCDIVPVEKSGYEKISLVSKTQHHSRAHCRWDDRPGFMNVDRPDPAEAASLAVFSAVWAWMSEGKVAALKRSAASNRARFIVLLGVQGKPGPNMAKWNPEHPCVVRIS